MREPRTTMDWKLVGAGLWGCNGTSVTIRFTPMAIVPYTVEWCGKQIPAWGVHMRRDEAITRAEEFIGELLKAGIDP